MDIFVKGNASAPENPNSKELWIDHETGLIHRPRGNAPIELEGPTSGSEYEQLKRKEVESRKLMLQLKRDMLSTWQCPQCRWKGNGELARIRHLKVEGAETEVLCCPNQKCDAPLVRIKDAKDLGV